MRTFRPPVLAAIAGALLVAACLENERLIAGNGNVEQRTTGGTLTYRALDGRLLFVGTSQTWINRDGALLTRPKQKVMNRSYLEIIGLGRPALPLLLRELRERPTYWFLALSSIARENPVRPGATFDEAVNDWLAWSRARALIDSCRGRFPTVEPGKSQP